LEIVARQIDQICAHRLTNTKGAPAAPNWAARRAFSLIFSVTQGDAFLDVSGAA